MQLLDAVCLLQVLVPDLITKIREDCAAHQRVPTKLSVHWRLKGSGYGTCRPGANTVLPQVYMVPTLQTDQCQLSKCVVEVS